MSLQPGHKLAHYEILEPIGKGGMGEVYRANDGKLGRDVAIKVLPDEFAQDEERLRRFQREAKVLASLNHPNIASIYGLEQSSETHYLVLELVPGETLAERIARGPIPVDEALQIATRIAEALEEAHEQGIVHRDLKPANVKLTPDDKVKVLDFGLAKAFAEEPAESDAATSMSPTITRDATRVGVILGTAAYMSPEQAKGKRVDRRTDVWAFGVVLFEMLTSRRPFVGDDVSDTLAAILKTDLDWSALPEGTPSPIRRMLRRCLERDRKGRLGWIGDARLEIDDMSVEAVAPALSRPTSAQSMIVGVVLALALGASLLWGFLRGNAEAPRDVLRLAVSIPQGFGTVPEIALSPDGTLLAYAEQSGDTRKLFLRRLESNETVLLPDTEGAYAPFFSPDGEWVGFASGRSQSLRKVAVHGNQPAITLTKASFRLRASRWGEDDFIYFSESDLAEVHRVSASGGAPEIVTRLGDGFEQIGCAMLLPGGRAMLVSRRDSQDFGLVDIESGIWTTLMDDGSCAEYVATGHVVFHHGTTLFAAPFDAKRLAVTGAPVPVLENVGVLGQRREFRNASISRSGHLAYVADMGGRERRLVRVDLEGRVEPLLAAPGQYWSPTISVDGHRIVVRIGDNESDLWVYQWERDVMTRLTFDPADDRLPTWTPDGKNVVFNSTRDVAGGNLYAIPSDGSGSPRRLTESESQHWPSSWSPDGKHLAVDERPPGQPHDISILAINSESLMSSDILAPKPFLETSFRESNARFSPDGRFVAYVSDESGRLEVYVRPFPGPGGKWQVSNGGGNEPVWSPKGEEIFYRNGTTWMAVNYSVDGDTFSSGASRELFDGAFLTQSTWRWYDVFPDGEHFVMLQDADAGDKELVFIVNWTEELNRLVPTTN